jgi:hypothetical protein
MTDDQQHTIPDVADPDDREPDDEQQPAPPPGLSEPYSTRRGWWRVK